MNPRHSETHECLQTMDRPTMRESSPFPMDGDVSHQQPLWIPDDIDEPDTWTLASFGDLLPHELA